MSKRHFPIAILLPVFSILIACSPSSQPKAPLSETETRDPQHALEGLYAGEGLEATLFAAEPMVRNPSNMDIDHKGRVWVVENVNYRPENNPDNPYQEGGDMITILEDTDGDGKADTRKVFFQGLLVDGAMGIGVFGNQVYLSSSPHILILTDEDGDDRADKVDTLFTGMGHKQGDHTIHAVSFGPDGRLYFGNGNYGGEILNKKGQPVIDKMGNAATGKGPAYQQGMVFRCEMDGSQLESLGNNFRNNYEVCVDSYGRMWQSDNDDDGNKSVRLNYVMEYGNFGYRDEMSREAWQVNRTGMHPDIPARHWHQNDPGVVPNLRILGSGSPCGITLYEGDLLPEVFRGSLMHADAGPGTVRAFPLTDAGAGFTTREVPMLMREADAWFRPTDVSVAPDGSVFAADWYDPGVGGHWAGDASRGRIYRIAPKSSPYLIPEMDIQTPKGAVEALKSPNAVTRHIAWTKLNHLGLEAEPALLSLWKSENPIYRARALWLLARLNISHVEAALRDSDEKIRATAIRVARQSHPDKLIPILKQIQTDPSPKVRREIAIALRELPASSEAAAIWAQLAQQHDGKDRWYLEALGIGAIGNWEACYDAWLAAIDEQWDTPAGRDIVWRSRAPKALGHLIQLLSRTDVPAAELARYLRATDFITAPNKENQLASLIGLERQDRPIFQQMLLTHISPEYARQSTEIRQVVQHLLPQLEGSREYLDLVDKLELQSEVPMLLSLALERPNHELGIRAGRLAVRLQGWEVIEQSMQGAGLAPSLALLRHINQSESKDLIISVIVSDSQEMAMRKQAIDALAYDWGWEKRMIKLLETESLPEELVTAAATRLLSAARPVDRAEGMKYLDDLSGENPTLPPIQQLVSQNGNHDAGKTVFGTYCQTCHQVGGAGTAYGPNLSEIANKLGKDALYSAILYPSAAISHGFEGVHYELKDGSHLVGYIQSETPDQVDLTLADGSTLDFPAGEVASREVLPNSLMPEGLGAAMGETALVDLVAYLSSLSNQATMEENPFQGKLEYEQGE